MSLLLRNDMNNSKIMTKNIVRECYISWLNASKYADPHGAHITIPIDQAVLKLIRLTVTFDS